MRTKYVDSAGRGRNTSVSPLRHSPLPQPNAGRPLRYRVQLRICLPRVCCILSQRRPPCLPWQRWCQQGQRRKPMAMVTDSGRRFLCPVSIGQCKSFFFSGRAQETYSGTKEAIANCRRSQGRRTRMHQQFLKTTSASNNNLTKAIRSQMI